MSHTNATRDEPVEEHLHQNRDALFELDVASWRKPKCGTWLLHHMIVKGHLHSSISNDELSPRLGKVFQYIHIINDKQAAGWNQAFVIQRLG